MDDGWMHRPEACVAGRCAFLEKCPDYTRPCTFTCISNFMLFFHCNTHIKSSRRIPNDWQAIFLCSAGKGFPNQWGSCIPLALCSWQPFFSGKPLARPGQPRRLRPPRSSPCFAQSDGFHSLREASLSLAVAVALAAEVGGWGTPRIGGSK